MWNIISDKENGPVQRNINEVTVNVWRGLVSYIQVLINKGYFGKFFPEECPDGQGCIGTEVKDFKAALLAEIPNLDWPPPEEVEKANASNPLNPWSREMIPYVPNYLDVMDLLQFCHKHIAFPIKTEYHSYFKHHHIMNFDVDAGRSEFRQRINTIFARNGLAYELQRSGDIIRLLSPQLTQMIGSVNAPREVELRGMLERANAKIINVNVLVRYDAVKELWDFWERLKSIYYPSNKKESVKQLLDAAANTPEFRTVLEEEAKSLTDIGNTYLIRHAEMTQVKIQESDHIEYLYQRLFSLIHLLLKTMPY
ncbi:TPA: stationary phase or STEss regulating sigma factor [Salmonella enterica subsp. salamae serovar 35:g,m,s,t:-]|nr:stationary phase or STEss regulating sigma factor [Salmonella enterica subsp. salamae serovar 35:g,m,s,t:-]HCA3549766.1 stationary phase or STEss regulating sigma factor [Salmonella enterica subsp. salamae serovar 35:g,m,s,t:-]